MTKNNPFCNRLKPSFEISSAIGDPTTGITAVAAALGDLAADVGSSSASLSPD